MLRTGNPSALFLGLKTGAAAVEHSMEFPQKLSFDLVIPVLGIYPKNPETPIQKG